MRDVVIYGGCHIGIYLVLYVGNHLTVVCTYLRWLVLLFDLVQQVAQENQELMAKALEQVRATYVSHAKPWKCVFTL